MADEGKRVLRTAVHAGGQWWPAGSTPPEDVAAKITNEKAWTTATPEEAEKVERAANAGTSSGARLARRVAVAGEWYGPDDPIPDDVARRIKNPNAWEGGELPTLSAAKADDAVKTGGADDAPTGNAETQDDGSADKAGGSVPAAEQKAPRKTAPVKRA